MIKKLLIMLTITVLITVGCSTQGGMYQEVRQRYPGAEIYSINAFDYIVVDGTDVRHIGCGGNFDNKISVDVLLFKTDEVNNDN